MIIIGIGHRSRVGKDTLAKFIIQYLRLNSSNLRITRISFASELKVICHNLYGHLGLMDEGFYNQEENKHLREIELPIINLTPVEIWINFGTLVGRHVYHDTWVSYVINKNKDYDVVITPDVRFVNETDYIIKTGGYVFELENQSVPPKDSVAEKELISWDGWTNRYTNIDGDFSHLMDIAIEICDKYILRRVNASSL